MKRSAITSICFASCLTWCAHPALGQYITLSFDDCLVYSGLNSTAVDCAGTGATIWVVYTFQLPVDQPQFIGLEGIIEMEDMDNAGNMGSWWQWDPAGCRTGEVLTILPAASSSPGWTGVVCEDLAQVTSASPVVTVAVVRPSPSVSLGPNSQRISFSWKLPDGDTIALMAGHQYSGGVFRAQSDASNGHSSCDRCGDRICMRLDHITSMQAPGAPGGDQSCDAPLPFPSENGFFTNRVALNMPLSWCAVVPVNDRTWGQLKSLYR